MWYFWIKLYHYFCGLDATAGRLDATKTVIFYSILLWWTTQLTWCRAKLFFLIFIDSLLHWYSCDFTWVSLIWSTWPSENMYIYTDNVIQKKKTDILPDFMVKDFTVTCISITPCYFLSRFLMFSLYFPREFRL